MSSTYLFNLSLITSFALFSSGCGSSSSSTQIPAPTNTADNPVNEPYYKYLWHINSNYENYKIAGIAINKNADINITEAWKITQGENVKIAVLDDAFDVNHEDLKENIYITHNVEENSTDVSNKTPLGFTDDEGNKVDGSHGNTCAGFIVAPINGKGIVGTAPKSKLIAVQFIGETDSTTIQAFEYAKQQGAKVISCSWGTENLSEAVESELKSLYDANITVLFASGNDGKSLDTENLNDESESPWVIGVGASGENNDITSYSNYSKNLEILAPGGDTEDSIGVLGIDDTGERGDENQKDVVTTSYAFTTGTSFATPITAGVVGLMYAINPNITPLQVRNILINQSDKIGGDDASYDENGFDEKRAYGKLNAGKAVLAAKKLL